MRRFALFVSYAGEDEFVDIAGKSRSRMAHQRLKKNGRQRRAVGVVFRRRSAARAAACLPIMIAPAMKDAISSTKKRSVPSAAGASRTLRVWNRISGTSCSSNGRSKRAARILEAVQPGTRCSVSLQLGRVGVARHQSADWRSGSETMNCEPAPAPSL